MLNKIKKLIIISLTVVLLFGCSSEINKKVDFPFETLEIIPFENNKTMSVIIIKTGINGGATVPFEYEFYFSNDEKDLSRNKLFLSVRGLDKYEIEWSSMNTINVNVSASRVVIFKSFILLNNKRSDFYYVNKFAFEKK